MNRRFRLILSAAAAVAACLLAVVYADSVREDALSERSEALARYGGEVTNLVVATQALSAGEELDAYNCEEREWLVDLMPDDAILSTDDAYGRIVSAPVTAGSVITSADIVDSSETFEIPSGRVALTIPLTDRLGIYKTVETGSVLAAYVIDGQTTRLVSSNVVVLAQESTSSSGSITLALLPEDVSAIVAASTDNTLRLVKPADDVVSLTSAQGPESVEAIETEDEGEGES